MKNYDKISASFLGILCLLGTGSLYAQTNDRDIPIIPPSPTAYSLGRAGFVRTGLFSGTASAEIPLAEYKTPNLSIPVSLHYSSNGVKVEALSTKTGIDWNLEAGGAIVRMVRDEPDVTSYAPSGQGGVMPEEVMNEVGSDIQNIALREYVLQTSKSGHYDSEYDIFSFNFLKHSGKFIITRNGEVIQEMQSSLRIEAIGGSVDNGFIITDDKGIRYVFTAVEKTQVNMGSDHRIPSCVTSWFLSEINHPLGDKIYFSYQRYITGFYYNPAEDYTLLSGSALVAHPEYVDGSSGYHLKLPVINEVEGLRISSITSNYGHKILFSAGMDNPGQQSDSLLTNMTVLSANGRVLDKIDFTYNVTDRKRVFLSAVNFLIPQKQYSLTYYSPEQLPERTSRAQDHWGFYNGATGNQTLLPKVPDFPRQDAYFYANREPDATYGVMGLLKSIRYPTGGITEITYEAHDYPITTQRDVSNYISVLSQRGTVDTGEETVSAIFSAAKNQVMALSVALSNSPDCPTPTDPDVIMRKGGTFRIEDVTTGANVPTVEKPGAAYVTVTNGLGLYNYTVALQAGHQYRIIVKSFSCSRLVVSGSYISSSETIEVNKVVGGMRVKEIKDIPLFGQPNVTSYAYTKGVSSTGSSGMVPYIVLDYYTHRVKNCWVPVNAPLNVYEVAPYDEDKVSSNTNNVIYDISGNNVVYNTVIESKAGNGKILHHFKYDPDNTGHLLFGTNSKRLNTFSNMYPGNGIEDYTAYYRENLTMVKELYSDYQVDRPELMQMITVIKGESAFPAPCDDVVYINTNNQTCLNSAYYDAYTCTADVVNKQYRYSVCLAAHRHTWQKNQSGIKRCMSIGSNNKDAYYPHPCLNVPVGTALALKKMDAIEAIKYTFYSHRYNLVSRREVSYDDNGNTMTDLTRFFYDNDNHNHIVESYNSKGEQIRDSSIFPSVLKGSAPVYDSMIARNMTGYEIENVKTNLANSQELTHVFMPYEIWGVNKLIAPQSMKQSYSGQAPFTVKTYDQYSPTGKLVQATGKDGVTEVYLWGYNDQYPVARILGSSYNIVSGKVNTAILNNPQSDQQLLGELNKLRTDLSKALVYTYSYLPFVGMTSETDPKGQVIYYVYDTYGRLILVKDQNGKILKQYKYQYQTDIGQ